MPNTPAPPDDDWNGQQLAARLLASGGAPPPATRHILFRTTSFADGRDVSGYDLPGEPGCGEEAALHRWAARENLTGDDLLGISVLVIREVMNAAGAIQECILEQRRGSATGPLYGNPARIEFVGPVRHLRAWRALRNGRLVETAPGPSDGPPRHPDTFSADDAALRARFGTALIVLDHRKPTLFEDMAGLTRAIHLRLPDGREIGCGIGWHGPMPFVLVADFPRFGPVAELPPRQEAAVAATLVAQDLVRYELRADDRGLGVVARERGGSDLFIIRPDSRATTVEPFRPGRIAIARDDQQRWIRYTETYERLSVLDVYQAQASEEMVVVTGDSDGQVWRHCVDSDGVEVSRAPANDTAVAALYQEQFVAKPVQAVDPSATVEVPERDLPAKRPAPPADSLLAKAQAVSDALSALRDARFAGIEVTERTDEVPATALRQMHALLLPLRQLGVPLSASATRDLIRRAELGTVHVEAFDAALEQIESRLLDELASQQVATVVPSWSLAGDDAPFGSEVQSYFFGAAYQFDEAARCLALHRPTAAVLHAMKIMRIALAAQARLLGTPDRPQAWQEVVLSLRAVAGRPAALIEAVDTLRRCWQSPDLVPADKYTEAEAEVILEAVAAFMRALAAQWDEREDADVSLLPR